MEDGSSKLYLDSNHPIGAASSSRTLPSASKPPAAWGMPSIGVNATTELAADIYVRSLADLPEDAFARLVEGRSPGPARQCGRVEAEVE